jgi:hypothetical protein
MKASDELFHPFTEEAMTRRIFEEPDPHIERSDGFSAPHGFLFGNQSGMGGSPDHLSLAQDYMEAAYALTEAILKGDWEDWRVAEPLMYLYRHATELFLKGVMRLDEKHHDLAALADEFGSSFQKRYGREMPEWVSRRLKEIASVDPKSTMFRYGKTYDSKAKRDYAIPGELYVNLSRLQDAMVALNWAIASTIGGICTERMEGLALRHSQLRYLQAMRNEHA